MSSRRVIVNADDLGLCAAVNVGIFVAHRCGIVTSASLMVCQQAAREAALVSRQFPELSIGLHIDLGEWAIENGRWAAVYEIAPLHDSEGVRSAVYKQVELFRSLLHRDPTHLDSHQHVHREDPARGILKNLAKELNVPLRHFTPGVTYCGNFYGQDQAGQPRHDAINLSALTGLIKQLPEGTSELACHPGFGAPQETMYRSERKMELDLLCRREVREVLEVEQIKLISFSEVHVGVATVTQGFCK